MANKLDRIEKDIQKVKSKIAEYNKQLRELEGQKTEQENLQIIQLVRGMNMTREEFAAFLRGGALQTAPTLTPYHEKEDRKIMQEMTHRHSRELDIFYNEHKDICTNCGKHFQNGMTAHLGYMEHETPAVLCDDCAHLLTETVTRYYWMKSEYDKVLPEAKLWRYMDLAKFISLIGKKKLFFTSAESFEDIFEGAKGIVERKPQWDNFYLDFFRHAIQTVPGAKPEELTDDYIQANSKRLLSELEMSGKADRKHTFISCWHCNQYESEAMWKLYSTNVKNAIAIQTTYQHLYEALGKNPEIMIGKVKYIDFSKRFSSINGAYWYKRKSFEHEQEVRAIIHGIGVNSRGIEKEIDLEKLISAIYISPYAPKWFEEVVVDIVNKYELHKPGNKYQTNNPIIDNITLNGRNGDTIFCFKEKIYCNIFPIMKIAHSDYD